MGAKGERHSGAGSAARAAAHAREASAAARSRRPVLLVDDRGWDREALAEQLRGRGLRPMTLPGPERALAHLSRPEEQPRAVLFPATIRGGPLALAQRLAELRPELPRLVVSEAQESAEPADLAALARVVTLDQAAAAVGELCESPTAAPRREATGGGS